MQEKYELSILKKYKDGCIIASDTAKQYIKPGKMKFIDPLDKDILKTLQVVGFMYKHMSMIKTDKGKICIYEIVMPTGFGLRVLRTMQPINLNK